VNNKLWCNTVFKTVLGNFVHCQKMALLPPQADGTWRNFCSVESLQIFTLRLDPRYDSSTMEQTRLHISSYTQLNKKISFWSGG